MDVIEPEQNRLRRKLDMLPRDETSHEPRRDIGDLLAVVGDTRPGVGVVLLPSPLGHKARAVPDIVWLPVSGSGEPVIIKTGEQEIGPVTIPDFYVARFLVTYEQFGAFVDAEDGFNDLRWWEGMPDEYKRQTLESQQTMLNNAPRDSVSWYQSVAFSRWLDGKYREHGLFEMLPALIPNPFFEGEQARRLRTSDWQIRLPTEWEWQWMAQGGAQAKAYPWGNWQVGCANSSEAGLNRTTAVGMYPHGAAECGALDVAGNLYEWCLNDLDDPAITDGYGNYEIKVLRGGSFDSDQNEIATTYRFDYTPHDAYDYFGLRLAVCPDSAL